MHVRRSLTAVLAAGFFCVTAGNVLAQSPAKPAPAMERTEHEWKDGKQSSVFGAHWMGSELKMIREEMNESAGMIEKNEYFFNAGTLLHYKQDRYPAPGKSGDATSIMASFDKTGKPAMSMKRLDGKPAGPASPAEIAQAQKHLAELLAITARVRR
jgi:hypothetical protein